MVNLSRQLLLEKVDLLIENKRENFDLRSIIDLISFLNQNQSKFPDAKVQRNSDNYLKRLKDKYNSVNNDVLIEAFGIVEFYKKQIFDELHINFKKDKAFFKQFFADVFDEEVRNNLFKEINSFDDNISIYEIVSLLQKEINRLRKEKKRVYSDIKQTSTDSLGKELGAQVSQTEPGRFFSYKDHVADKDRGATQDLDSIRSQKSTEFIQSQEGQKSKEDIIQNIDQNIEALNKKINVIRAEERKFSSANQNKVELYLKSLISKKSKEDGGDSIRQTISNLGSVYIDSIEFQDLYSKITIRNKDNPEEIIKLEEVKQDRWIMIAIKELSLKFLSREVNKDSENQSVLQDYINEYEKSNNEEIYSVKLEKLEELDIEKLRSFFSSFSFSDKSLLSKATDEKTDDDVRFEQIQKFFFDTNSHVYNSIEEQIKYYLIMLSENKEDIKSLLQQYVSKKVTGEAPKVNWNQPDYRRFSYLNSDRYDGLRNKILLLENPFDEIKQFESIVSNFELQNKLQFTFFRPLIMFFIFLSFYKKNKLDNIDEIKTEITNHNWLEDFKIALNIKEGYQLYSSKKGKDEKDLKVLSILQDFILGKFRFTDREGKPEGDSSMKEAKDYLAKFMKKHGENFDRELFSNIVSIGLTKNQYRYAKKDEVDQVEEILNKEKAKVAKLLRPMLWSYMLDRYKDLNLIETQRLFYQLILVFEKAITEFRFDYEGEEYNKASLDVPAYREYASLFLDNPEDPEGAKVVSKSKFVNYLFYKLEEFRKNKALNYYSNAGNTAGHNKTKQEKEESTEIVSSRYLYARPINDVDLSELVNTLLSIVKIEQVPVYTNVDKFSKQGKDKVKFNVTVRDRVDYRMTLKDSLLKNPELLYRKLNPISKFIQEELSLKLENLLRQKKISKSFFDYVPMDASQQKSSTFKKTSAGMKRVASTRDVNPVEMVSFKIETTPYFDTLINYFDDIKSILKTFELSNQEILGGLYNSTKNNIQLSEYSRQYVIKMLQWIVDGEYDNIIDFIKSTLDVEKFYDFYKNTDLFNDNPDQDEQIANAKTTLPEMDTETARISKKIKSTFKRNLANISPFGVAQIKNKKDYKDQIQNALNLVQNINGILENIFVYLHDLANESLDKYKESITSKNLNQKEYDQKKTVYNEEKLSNIVIGVLDMLKEKYIASGLGSTLNVKTALYRMAQGKLMPDFDGYKSVGHLSTGRTSELHPFVDVSSDSVDVNKKFLRIISDPSKFDKSQIGDRKARAIAAQINAQYRLLYSIQEGNDNLEDINRKMTNRIHSEVSAEFTRSQKKQFFLNSAFTNHLLNRINRAIFKNFKSKISLRDYNFDSPTWFLENDNLRSEVIGFVSEQFFIPMIKKQLEQQSDKFGQPKRTPSKEHLGMNLKYTTSDRDRQKRVTGENEVEPYQFDTRKSLEDLPQVIDQPKGVKKPVVSTKPMESLLEKILAIKVQEFERLYPQYLELKGLYNRENKIFIDQDISEDIEANRADLFEELHDMSTKDKIDNLNKVAYKLDEMMNKDMFKPYRSNLQSEYSGQLYKELEANLALLNKAYEENTKILDITRRFLHAKTDKMMKNILGEFYKLNSEQDTFNLIVQFYNKFNNLGVSSEILDKESKRSDVSNRTSSVLLSFLAPIIKNNSDPGWGQLTTDWKYDSEDNARLLMATKKHLMKDWEILKEVLRKTKKDIDNIESNKKIISQMSEDEGKINTEQLNQLMEKLKKDILNSPYTSKDAFENVIKELPRDEGKYKVMSEKLLYSYLQYVYTREYVFQQVINEYMTIMKDDEFFLTEKNKNKVFSEYFHDINHLPCIEFDFYIGEKNQYKDRYEKNETVAKFMFKNELMNELANMSRDKFIAISNNVINYLLGVSDFTFSADLVTAGIKSDSTTQSDIAGADVLVGTTKQENSILSKLQKEIYSKYGLINIRKKISNYIETEEFKYAMKGHSSTGPTVGQLKSEAKTVSKFTVDLSKYLVSIKRLPQLKNHLNVLNQELAQLQDSFTDTDQDEKLKAKIKNKAQADLLKGIGKQKEVKKENDVVKKSDKTESQKHQIESEIARIEAYEELIDKNYMNLVTKSLRMFIRAMVNLSETGKEAPPISDQFSSYNELMNKITNPPKLDSSAPIKIAEFMYSCIETIMSENNQNSIYQNNVINVIKPAYTRLISTGDSKSIEMNDGEQKEDINIYSTKVSPKENQQNMINELNELKNSQENVLSLIEKFDVIFNKITSYLKAIKLLTVKNNITRSHSAVMSSKDEKIFKNKLESFISIIQKQKFPEVVSESKFHDLLMIDNSIKKVIKLISSGPNENVQRYELAKLREGVTLMLRLSTIPSYNYDKYKIFLGNENMKNNYVIEFIDSANKTFEDRKYIWIIPKQTVS